MSTLTPTEYEKIGRAKVLAEEIAALTAEADRVHASLASLLANAKGAYAADQMAAIDEMSYALSEKASALNVKRAQLSTLQPSTPSAGGGDDYTP